MAFEEMTFRRYGRFYRNIGKYAARQDVIISVYLILSLFTISFFAAVFIRPTVITIAKVWREIQDKRVVSAQLEKKINDLEKAQTIYSSLEDDLFYISLALPNDAEYLRLAQELEYLAFINEVTYVSSSFGEVEIYSSEEPQDPPTSIGTHDLSLTFRGSNSSILSLIADIERLDRLIVVSSITITSAEDDSGSSTFLLSLTLESNVYSFPEGLDTGD